jgi:hypothetical protein
MRFKIALLFAILSGCIKAGEACSLAYRPISYALEIYPQRAIVYGKITKVEAQFSELETIRSLDNGNGAPDTIRIWDEKDFECNGIFPLGSEAMGSLGDTVLIIAPKITSQKNGWDVIGEYRMPFFHGTAALFNFKTGSARYDDADKGIERELYSGAEMVAIMQSYLTPNSLRSGTGSVRKPGGEWVFDLRHYDLNGKSKPQPE